MKQGDRRLFVIKGAHLQPLYPNLVNSIVFYDINILRVFVYIFNIVYILI
jgi:hypothetical protein